MKKKILTLVIIIAAVASFAVSASAGSHHGKKHSAKNPVCTVKTCTKTKSHYHDGKIYSAHNKSYGHSYHQSKEQCH